MGQFQQFAFGCITHNVTMCHYLDMDLCCCSDIYKFHYTLRSAAKWEHLLTASLESTVGSNRILCTKKVTQKSWLYFWKSFILANEIKFSVGVLGVSHGIHRVEPWNNSFLCFYFKFMTSVSEYIFSSEFPAGWGVRWRVTHQWLVI